MNLIGTALAALALAPGQSCATVGETVVANAYIRVYSVRDTVLRVRRVYACHRGHRRLLTEDDYLDGNRLHVGLARWRVAFEDDRGVVRYDARRDRLDVLSDREGGSPASALVITPGGAAAWIRDGRLQVPERVLDTGASSLAVSGRRIYWMGRGQPRTAVLRAPASAAAPVPRAGTSRDCAVRGRTIVANADVRLYIVSRPLLASRIYYACDLRRRRARFIDRNDEGDGLRRIALARRQVAFETSICDRDGTCDVSVFRYDVSRHRFTFLSRWDRAASDLLITRTGAVAWIRRGQVVATDATGLRVLDEGARSLAVAGRRVYWTRGGEARSAPLD